MKQAKLWWVVTVATLLLLTAGIVGALPPLGLNTAVTDMANDPYRVNAAQVYQSAPEKAPTTEVAADVAGRINYQGRLTAAGGAALSGTFNMQFQLYDAADGGTLLWDSGLINVPVSQGLFNVALEVDPADFNGQALWLRQAVSGEWLAPRQEILPAPYALSLRPGSTIEGDPPNFADAVLDVHMPGFWPSGRAGGFHAPSTGTAVFADANGGTGIFGTSDGSYGIWGSSNNSWGGFFTSSQGYGVRIDTNGTDHWDHGAYVTSVGGYGVYAKSTQNQGLRGEAGDVTGISQPLGPVGTVGIGSSRGVYGASSTGVGVYGTSSSNYGIWGQSNSYRGVTGRTDRVDNNYGFYTPDNLYSLNYNLAGAIMYVVQNGGQEALQPGDVVIFSGMTTVAALDGQLVAQVAKTTEANHTAVAGVVYSRFNVTAVSPEVDHSDDTNAGAKATIAVTPEGAAAPGDYLLLVVQGPAQVKASALHGSIQPGDLLATGSQSGHAGKAAKITMNRVMTTIPGTVLGKALEPLAEGQKMITIFVTLQ